MIAVTFLHTASCFLKFYSIHLTSIFIPQREKQVLALLSKLDAKNVHFTESLPSEYLVNFSRRYLYWCSLPICKYIPCSLGDANQSVHIVADEGLEAYLPLADMVDVSEEVKRLSKRLSKMQTEYDALLARLSSPSVCRLFLLLCVS
jgi:valyl-tRNA synthetase